MVQNEINDISWDFITTSNVVKTIKTMPYITAKIKHSVQKLYNKSVTNNIVAILQDPNQLALIAAKYPVIYDELKLMNSAEIDTQNVFRNISKIVNNARFLDLIETSHELELDEAIQFCINCLDLRNLTTEEKAELLDYANWELQPPEIIEGIIKKYSFRILEIK